MNCEIENMIVHILQAKEIKWSFSPLFHRKEKSQMPCYFVPLKKSVEACVSKGTC